MSILGRLARPIVRLRSHRHHLHRLKSRKFVLSHFARHSVGAEIGVWKGEFSALVLDVVQPKRFYLVDPWKYQTSPDYSRALYGGTKGRDQVNLDEIHRSVVEKFSDQINGGIVEVKRAQSEKAAAEFPDNYLDWIYVDGDHRFEAVLKDLVLYHPKLKPGGIAAGDDYADTGQWWGDGVMRGVAEAVKRGLYRDLMVKYDQFVLVRR